MKKFVSEINEFKIYKIAESGQMFRVFHPNDNHRYEDFYSFDNAKTYIENALPELPPYFDTSIKDFITEAITDVNIKQINGCIWITLGNERDARIFIDSVDNSVRVGIYKENAQDSEEPEIYPTGYKTR